MKLTYNNFVPSARSLFLTSLSSEPGLEKAANLGKKVLGNIPSSLQVSAQESQKHNKFQIALKVLEQSIKYEQASERQYLENLVKGLPNAPAEFKQALSATLQQFFPPSGGSVDYIGLIKFLNSLLQGEEETKTLVQYEQDRLKQLNDAHAAALSREVQKILAEQSEPVTKEAEEKAQEQAKEALRNIYLDQHTFYNVKSLSDLFNQIPTTIDYLMADYISKATLKVLNEKAELIAKLHLEGEQYPESIILTQVLKEAQPYVQQILKSVNDEIKKADIINKMVNEFSKKMNKKYKLLTVNDLPENFGTGKKRLARRQYKLVQKAKGEKELFQIVGKRLTDTLRQSELVLNINARSQYEELIKILGKSGSAPDKDNATKTFLARLEQLAQMEASLEKAIYEYESYRRKNGIHNTKKNNKIEATLDRKATNVTNIRRAIAAEKQSLSLQLKKRIQSAIDEEANQEIKNKIIEEFKKAIMSSKVQVTGPDYSEVIDAIIQQAFEGTTTFATGKRNTKADTITVQVDLHDPDIELNDKSIAAAVSQAAEEEAKAFYQHFMFGSTNTTGPKVEGIYAPGKSFSLERGAAAWKYSVKQYQKNLREIKNKMKTSTKDKEKQTAILKAFEAAIKSTVFVTTTMKTFNQYHNEIGFLSGSLGASITEQIQNFATLFESAGARLNKEEIQFLEVAVVNCSPAAMGAGNKGPLEQLLSTLAGFAMFDEGSAELELVIQQSTTTYGAQASGASPKVMHLYKLNGFYFPGSYILDRVYEHLMKVTGRLQEEVNYTNNNDGAVIRATADKTAINTGITNKRDRWNATFARAASKEYTEISFAFISGLLDIVNQLNDAFNVQ